MSSTADDNLRQGDWDDIMSDCPHCESLCYILMLIKRNILACHVI